MLQIRFGSVFVSNFTCQPLLAPVEVREEISMILPSSTAKQSVPVDAWKSMPL